MKDKTQTQAKFHYPLEAIEGKEVEITLRHGGIVKGEVVKSSQYEIEVKSRSSRYFVFKHAIETIKVEE